MSVFRGAQGKGAMRRHRDERYKAAVGRQQLLADRGWYHRPHDITGEIVTATPAPVDEFLRAEHRLVASPRIDFRSYAREANR